MQRNCDLIDLNRSVLELTHTGDIADNIADVCRGLTGSQHKRESVTPSPPGPAIVPRDSPQDP